MALDPTISLYVRPPQITAQPIGPLQLTEQALSLQNMMRQGILGQIQLQQARQQFAEQQALRDYFTSLVSPQAPAAQPSALTPPPITAPAPAAPAPYIPGETPGSESLARATLAPTTAPAAGPLAPAAPMSLPAAPAAAQQFPQALDYNKIMSIAPLSGPAFIESHAKATKAILENQESQYKILQDQNMRRSQLAQGVYDEQSKTNAITTAYGEGLIDGPTARRLMQLPYNDPQWGAFQQQALTADQAITQQRENLKTAWQAVDQAHKEALYPGEELKAKISAADTQRMDDANRLAAAFAQGPTQGQAALQQLPPERAAPFMGAASPLDIMLRAKPEQYITEAGKAVPKPPAVEAQEVREATQKEYARIAAEAGIYMPTVASVISGKTRFQDLPQETQTKIAPYLAQGGYQGFGKDLSDAERQRLTDLNNAIAILQDTKKNVNDSTNRTFMGPASVGVRYVPGVGSRIQELDANFGLAQQKLKGFITNKSLRGLSSEGLGAIFPTSTSTPVVNDYKIQHLLDTVTAERDQFIRDLGGKVIPPGVTTGAPGRAGAAAAPAAVPTAGEIRAGSGGKKWMFIGGDPNDKNNWKEYHEQ